MSFRDRRAQRKQGMAAKQQGGGFDSGAFQKQMNSVGTAQGTQEAQGRPTQGMRAPAPAEAQAAPARQGGFDAGAFARQMDSVGTAQGTQEAQAAGPAGQKRRLSSVRVQGM